MFFDSSNTITFQLQVQAFWRIINNFLNFAHHVEIVSPMYYTGSMKSLRKERSGLTRPLLILTGALLIFDTLFVMTRSSPNLGVIMPALIGAPLLLAGLLLPLIKKLCAKSRAARFLRKAFICVYVLFALLFAFTTALILINSAPPEGSADVLIVLGCGIRGESPTLTMKHRLDKAVEYLEKHPDALAVVSGGQSYDEAVSEASVMRRYLVSHGVDEARIIVEDRSESTEENFLFSKQLIDERLGADKSIAFVTTRFHVFRSELVAGKLGINAQGIPAKGVWYITLNDYLRECAALTQYFLSGRI